MPIKPCRKSPAAFLFVLLVFPAAWPSAGLAQRLSQDVVPRHYSLDLVPDTNTATFTGKEAIDLTLSSPADSITLNADQLKFRDVAAIAGGKTLPAKVSLDAEKQQATFHFSETLPAGEVKLEIRFSGILNSELRGFYLSKAAGRKYAVTQFEPTDARRAFPCFDEPAFKATFDITLTVDKDDMAISNGQVVADTPGPGSGRHTVRFATTPKMSTYLVAFLVGDFQCLSGESDGVPIRVCAIPEHIGDGHFALSAAEFFLHYYDHYFGIQYPMPKLDLIAIPDFEAGAMENFGAITFREAALLVDPATGSIAAQQVVARDVAHEMAHQWFGDMVTMAWWNNLWLNEGFATWMQNKPVALWKPEWDMPQIVAANLNGVLDIDAQPITRTIRAKADTPAEINQMFDAITYQKAGAVLLMVENYLGEQTFRAGVHKYLEEHMYGNATAQDFWNAQTAVSHKPVDKIMEGYVTEPGEPLLTFGPVKDGRVQVTQRRFFLNSKAEEGESPLWAIPVCLKTGDAPDCRVLSERSESLNLPKGPLFFGNAGGKGYYRDQYDPAEFRKLAGGLESALTPAERILFLGSQWALMQSEKLPLSDFMGLAGAVKSDSNPQVFRAAADPIFQIDQQIVSTPKEHRELAKWVRATYGPAYRALGAPASADSPAKKELRAELFFVLGTVGDDSQVIAESKRLVNRYLGHPGSVDPTLGTAAVNVASRNGNAKLFQRLRKISEDSESPQLRRQALYSLALFRDPALLDQTFEYAVSGKVRNQDSAFLLTTALADRETQSLAWDFIQTNWPKVRAQLTITTGQYLVDATGSFCSADRSREVEDFFAKHPVPASSHELAKARQQIGDCAELRSSQGPVLKKWLAAQ